VKIRAVLEVAAGIPVTESITIPGVLPPGSRSWHLLSDPTARFIDLGPGWHDEQVGRDRKIRNHLRQLKTLGLDVTVNPAAA